MPREIAPDREELTQEMKDCQHTAFRVGTDVLMFHAENDKTKIIGRAVQVRVICDGCGVPMEFVGAPTGATLAHPSVSDDYSVMSAPIIPATDKPKKNDGIVYN